MAITEIIHPRPISSEMMYENYLQKVDSLMVKDDLSDNNAELLEHLLILIDYYESDNYNIKTDHLTPIDRIKYKLEVKGLKQKDLIGIIGTKGVVSEVLNKKRKLSLAMIRNVSEFLNIPIDKITSDYLLSN
ncbi:hypothetical protein EI427_16345 [Flammeovirga pectinis]|uniref:HTH cro/C1-type domain-containing protein n=1 Tax=Flammeovirga pectinis TaxID=2494373 RepID=A0A3Q9FQ06_9BACT|nr:hypothetical protein [Flammeovirga pectinis]AZQ63737.1 hypothetical protein EI427_16345 [Flammeovirga pectinis]